MFLLQTEGVRHTHTHRERERAEGAVSNLFITESWCVCV